MAGQTYLADYPSGYPSGGVKLKLIMTTVETSVTGNWTKERADLYMQVDDSSGNYRNFYNQHVEININGEQINGVCTYDARSTGDKALLLNQVFTIYHDVDGNKSFTVTAKHESGSSLGTAELARAYYCDTIPRYLNITNHSITNKGINKFTVNWASDVTRDWTQYSLDGGGWTDAGDSVAGDGKSGNYTITGLNPNTTHSIRTRLRRADNQLYTESGTLSVTTIDKCRITSPTIYNVNTDTALTVQASNPSNSRVDIYIELLNSNKSARIGNYVRYNNVNPKTFSVSDMLTLASYIPNSNTANFRINVVTYVSDSETYTDYKDGIFSIVNANPVFSNFTYADINTTTIALTGSNQKIIKGYSNVKTTISTANKATAQKSATMSKYTFKNGSQQIDGAYSSSANVDMTLNGITDSTMQIYAIDSRGNSTQKNIVASTFVNYFPINIKALSGSRSSGGVGTDVTLVYNGDIFNSSFGAVSNSIASISYKYKKTTDSTYTTGSTSISPTLSGNSFSFSGLIAGDLGASGFDSNYSYNIQVTITDKLSSYTYDYILQAGTPQMAFGSKKLVGVGKFPDATLPEGSLDVAGAGSFSKGILTKNLPDGDTTTYAYWHGIPNGYYWCGNYSGVTNKPTSYGIVQVTRANGWSGATDFSVLWFTQNSGDIYRICGNSNSITGWRSLTYDDEILNKTYPVGAIYQSTVSTSPATLFGGTWVQLTDRMLIGAGGSYSAGSTGGESTHTLSVTEIPGHGHGVSGGGYFHVYGQGGGDSVNSGTSFKSVANTSNTGGGGAHNNLPPYRAVYQWYRSA